MSRGDHAWEDSGGEWQGMKKNTLHSIAMCQSGLRRVLSTKAKSVRWNRGEKKREKEKERKERKKGKRKKRKRREKEGRRKEKKKRKKKERKERKKGKGRKGRGGKGGGDRLISFQFLASGRPRNLCSKR